MNNLLVCLIYASSLICVTLFILFLAIIAKLMLQAYKITRPTGANMCIDNFVLQLYHVTHVLEVSHLILLICSIITCTAYAYLLL